MIQQRFENHDDSSSIERLLTAATVACILGISPKTVHKLVREGKLGCVQITARERRFTHQQVEDYVRSQTISGTALTKGPPTAYHRLPRKGVRNRLAILG